MDDQKPIGKARGGLARAKVLSAEQRKGIAEKAALARWGSKPPRATHKGNFKDDFGINVECYVLNDATKTAVISQRGMGAALGYSEGGSRFSGLIKSKVLADYLGRELIEKIENPIIFQGIQAGENTPSTSKIHGYDVSILIEVCQAIVKAEADNKLKKNQDNLAKQARMILAASAKAGIKGLVYALAGYNPSAEEVISAFKAYIQEEARKYEQEFPNELYLQWHRLYNIPVPVRGKPWHFKHLTVKHIYYPLAKSNGKLLELLRALKSKDGDRQKKLFQFLNEVGARALRMQLGRVLEMAESSTVKDEYEKKINDRFGEQMELQLIIT